MKKSFLNFVFLFICTGFLSAQSTTIDIKMQYDEPVRIVYFTYSTPKATIQDSGQLVNNRITFKANVNEATLSSIRVIFNPSQGNKTSRIDNTLNFWIEPGKINLQIKDSAKLTDVKGSKANTEWVKVFNELRPYKTKSIAIAKEFVSAGGNMNPEQFKELMGKKNALRFEERDNVYKKYLVKNPNSPIAVYVLGRYAGDTFYDIDDAWSRYNSLSDKNKNSEAGLYFLSRLENEGQLKLGRMALDFTQNDTLGNPISLSSFKGQYVLLDFWASWCAPCRDENPNVVKAFNQFKDKNFTVIGISLDQPGKHAAWLDAIHKDNLTWTQLSDLKGWANEVAKLYGISSIPQNLLLDPEGRIVAKNIRGEGLIKTLEEIIK
ncbi:MAG: TlpA disulfide reductase family protein [Ginsengibacter sp.]